MKRLYFFDRVQRPLEFRAVGVSDFVYEVLRELRKVELRAVKERRRLGDGLEHFRSRLPLGNDSDFLRQCAQLSLGA